MAEWHTNPDGSRRQNLDTMNLSLEEIYSWAALIGLLAAQTNAPDQEWACKWCLRMGEKMAAAARKRRRKR